MPSLGQDVNPNIADPTPGIRPTPPAEFEQLAVDITNPTSPTVVPKQSVDTIRAAVQTQLDEANRELDGLRAQRDVVNARIREAVAARDELARIVHQLTPRMPRKAKS